MDTEANLKGIPLALSKTNLRSKPITTVVDFNTLNKKRIQASTLLQIRKKTNKETEEKRALIYGRLSTNKCRSNNRVIR